ncbi:unnamed protein product [Protopolystoma xenopodis]|uniref:Uncharacterized protein n=1 Tax=Protopolystoma xenopodis TaxID=117903 RepID=A0A3S5A9U8_9PLAT|nr:unnamed protein product [Protopolystoma xenopodis]
MHRQHNASNNHSRGSSSTNLSGQNQHMWFNEGSQGISTGMPWMPIPNQNLPQPPGLGSSGVMNSCLYEQLPHLDVTHTHQNSSQDSSSARLMGILKLPSGKDYVHFLNS